MSALILELRASYQTASKIGISTQLTDQSASQKISF